MQLMLIADIGPELSADRMQSHRLIELACAIRHCSVRQPAAHGRRSAGAALCGRVFFVEEGIGHRVDQLMGEERGHRRVDSETA